MLAKFIRHMAAFTMTGILIILAFSTTTQAGPAAKNRAKTSVPPTEIHIMGMFNPNQLYLQDGFNKIAQGTSGQAKLMGTTYANQKVNSIGVTLYLQKWTGSNWVNVGFPGDYSSSSRDSYTNEITYSNIETGYYYRARTIHWIVQDGTYEQGERVSDYLLIK
jgi:hypothetical protein